MKKVILSIAVITAASFTSCKKDRTCTCTRTDVETTTISAPGQTPKTETETTVTPQVVTFTKARKGDAKSACASYKTSETETTGSTVIYTIDTETTVDCTLK